MINQAGLLQQGQLPASTETRDASAINFGFVAWSVAKLRQDFQQTDLDFPQTGLDFAQTGLDFPQTEA